MSRMERVQALHKYLHAIPQLAEPLTRVPVPVDDIDLRTPAALHLLDGGFTVEPFPFETLHERLRDHLTLGDAELGRTLSARIAGSPAELGEAYRELIAFIARDVLGFDVVFEAQPVLRFHPPGPMMDRYRWLGLATGVALADQGAKHWIAGAFPLGAGETVLPFFNLVHLLNSGAAFSFLANSGGWQRYVFLALALVVSVGLTIILLKGVANRWEGWGYSLLLGGAVGNQCRARNKDAKVAYVHSERFVGDMVRALQHNAINEFKQAYRTLDALLIDDIQFFAGKDRSQEEFFHTFNTLLEGQQQVILTCDRYPKEVEGLEERLKSRFGWGLTVAIEPPELETCVAILMSKSAASGVELPEEVAFFVAKRIRSNVRELEGAMRRVIANSQFTGRPITLDFAKEALKDLLALQERLVTIENIQKTVADYYKIRISDMHSKKRSRAIARPRQVAMALAQELTQLSLPEIGSNFGGRDPTTVLHACRPIAKLRQTVPELNHDVNFLLQVLRS